VKSEDLKFAEPPKERAGIQSLERAFAILEEIARHRKASASPS